MIRISDFFRAISLKSSGIYTAKDNMLLIMQKKKRLERNAVGKLSLETTEFLIMKSAAVGKLKKAIRQ
ncbi:Uncharacterized protein BM_BM13133 [Brugia malayi]|uniref:Bm13133 n=1 Tax=Brugia malayi TaxID=6279 RepID=A0A0K0IWZ1_BRUMA|nr:Uncharacterized protein BM_BM13133 [Brugia malayi]CDP97819.1 Bm13133 [Brugia malayi]VIO95761.1 Uncharacterized protein BM_BM13133 [Brugia malayi]